jgi:dTDP-4-amino-4,6-dideoxygalactose transaminase
MSEKSNKIFVTQPSLPPLSEFTELLEQIWENKILTNKGPFYRKLEKEISDYLGVKHITLFTNGTLALLTALQALEVKGEVITTPYSFIATTNALWWNNIKPVFVDIEPETFNLDPSKIEAAITSKTTAILPVHVYGNPCNVGEIQKVADKYGLKVIYDACHTFGVTIHDVPVLNFGDLSVMSFHATKVFNTFEGGAIVCHDEAMKTRVDQLKNFGITSETTVVAPGINGKMNEVQAAMGLLQLRYIDKNIEIRKQITDKYRELLADIPGISFLNDFPDVKHCYSYFPVIVDKSKYGISRDILYENLKKQNIHCRRYFYPLINQFPIYHGLESGLPGKLPVAEAAAQKIICLPIYPALSFETIEYICELIKG